MKENAHSAQWELVPRIPTLYLMNEISNIRKLGKLAGASPSNNNMHSFKKNGIVTYLHIDK